MVKDHVRLCRAAAARRSPLATRRARHGFWRGDLAIGGVRQKECMD